MLKRFGAHLLAALLVITSLLSIGAADPPINKVEFLVIDNNYQVASYIPAKLTRNDSSGISITGEVDGGGILEFTSVTPGSWILELFPDQQGSIPSSDNARYKYSSYPVLIQRVSEAGAWPSVYDSISDTLNFSPANALTEYPYFMHIRATDIETGGYIGDINLTLTRTSRTVTTWLDGFNPAIGAVVGVDPSEDTEWFTAELDGSQIATTSTLVAHNYGLATQDIDIPVNTSRSTIDIVVKDYFMVDFPIPAGITDAEARCTENNTDNTFSTPIAEGASSVSITVIPGDFTCSVTISDDYFTTTTDVTIGNEQDLSADIVAIERNAPVGIQTVDDATGDPILVKLDYLLVAQQDEVIPDSFAKTEVEGNAIIKIISGIDYIVTASFSNGSGGYSQPVSQVVNTASLSESLIEFRVTAQTAQKETVSVTVRDPDGNLLTAGTVKATSSNNIETPAAISAGSATLDLDPGDYSIRAIPQENSGFLSSATVNITVDGSESLSLVVQKEQRIMKVTTLPDGGEGSSLLILSTDCTAIYTESGLSIHRYVDSSSIVQLPLADDDSGAVELTCYSVAEINGESIYLNGKVSFTDSSGTHQDVSVSLDRPSPFVEEETFTMPEETGGTIQIGSGTAKLTVPEDATDGEGTLHVTMGSSKNHSPVSQGYEAFQAFSVSFFLEAPGEQGTRNRIKKRSDAERLIPVSKLKAGKSAMLEIQVDSARLAELGKTIADVKAASYDPETGLWDTNVAQAYNPDTNTMYIAVTRTSVWGLLVSLLQKLEEKYIPEDLGAEQVPQAGKSKKLPYRLYWKAPNSASKSQYTVEIASIRAAKRNSRDLRGRKGKKKKGKKKGKKKNGKKKKGKKKGNKGTSPSFKKNGKEYTITGSAEAGAQESFVISLAKRRIYSFRVKMVGKPYSEEFEFEVKR